MSLVALLPAADLGAKPVHVEHADLDLVIVRVGADVFALEDRCSHGDVPLSEGELDGCQLECWLHGSSFDVRSGEPSGPPAVSPVKTYPATISDVDGTAMVCVEIG